jgi:hypothetical protein
VLGAEESRLTCGLPGASSTTLATFRAEYQSNTNPTITTIGDPQMNPVTTVGAGQTVTLSAFWPSCAAGAKSCGGAEVYALYDEQAQTVTPVCETMTVSWFANAGSFAADRSGPDAKGGAGLEIYDGGSDAGTAGALVAQCDEGPNPHASNQWTAPTTPGTALIWAVLRDDRGGVTWQRISIAVH